MKGNFDIEFYVTIYMVSRKTPLIVFIILLTSNVFGQENEDDFFSIEAPVTLNLEDSDDEIIEPKKKKRKRNHYYGIKTKKGFTRKGFGNNITIELFYFLKDPVPVDRMIRDIYWFDFRRREIRKGPGYDPEIGALLHGPYKKVIGNQVLDSGVFYIGKKHGTWMYHDRNDVLIDKEKYYKGWPRESMVRYYDKERTQMREIIPVEFGEKEGNYFYFFKDSKIAVRGEYKWDQKVGDWIEYYPSGRRKKIIRYPKDPFADEKPFILREWNSDGREVYDYFKARR